MVRVPSVQCLIHFCLVNITSDSDTSTARSLQLTLNVYCPCLMFKIKENFLGVRKIVVSSKTLYC